MEWFKEKHSLLFIFNKHFKLWKSILNDFFNSNHLNVKTFAVLILYLVFNCIYETFWEFFFFFDDFIERKQTVLSLELKTDYKIAAFTMPKIYKYSAVDISTKCIRTRCRCIIMHAVRLLLIKKRYLKKEKLNVKCMTFKRTSFFLNPYSLGHFLDCITFD